MKNILVLILVLTAGRAEAAPALDCLQASARSGGLGGCLNESGMSADAPAVAAGRAHAPAPALAAAEPRKPAYRRVPTPTGWKDSEDGTLEAGFYKGLDSGFKTAFAGIVWPAVSGMEASGIPYHENAAGYFFTGLGVILAIPASIIGVVLGAPIGAAAGMIAEMVSPGSTKGWYTF